MYCMAPSPSPSRRGGSPRWISRGMNRRGNPPKRFHPFRQSAIMGHPPGCGLPGAFRRGGRIMGDTAADGNRCGRFPVSCPIFAAEQDGIVRAGKKEALSLPKFPYSTHYAFFLLLSAKKRNFFPSSPAFARRLISAPLCLWPQKQFHPCGRRNC